MTTTRLKAFFPQPAPNSIDPSSRIRSPPRQRRFARCSGADGHFVFELEADATIPAEYVLMRHYRGEPVDAPLEAKIARYLRRIQSAEGGWPLFHAGASDMSASVKAYFALKMIGERGRCPAHGACAHLDPRREAAPPTAMCSLATCLRFMAVIPWRARAGDARRNHAAAALVSVPSRQGLLLGAHGARTADGAQCDQAARASIGAASASTELFATPPEDVRHWPKGAHQTWPWAQIFGGIDRVLARGRALFPEDGSQAGDR